MPRQVIIFADDRFVLNNRLQIEAVKCYCENKSLPLHVFSLKKTSKCKQNIAYYRRHCLLSEIMKNWKENDFSYVIDSDVIAHDYEDNHWEYQDLEKSYDLIFYERWWSGEIMAGGYAVKNNEKTREFLKKWAELEKDEPKGSADSADNGAIHVAIMNWFKGPNNTRGKSLLELWVTTFLPD